MFTFGTVVFYIVAGGWKIPTPQYFYKCPLHGTIEDYKDRWTWTDEKTKDGQPVGKYTYTYLVKFKCSNGEETSLWFADTVLSEKNPDAVK